MATDKSEDKDKGEDKTEEEELTLAQVHEKTVIELENEESKEGDEKDGDDKKDEDAGSDADKGDDAGDGGSDDEADGGKGDSDDASGSDDEPAKPVEPKRAEDGDKSAPELDTDTTKNAKGKVSVKDFEGKTHYFNDLEEVPDDFEPSSYKEWGRAVQKFTDSAQTSRKDAADAEVKKEDDERTARVQAIQADWDKDEKSLVDQKLIPSEPKERQAVVDAVHEVMRDKLSRGKVVDFETAFEIHSAKQDKDEDKAAIDKKNEDKKKRAGMVAGSGSGASAKPAGNQGRTIEAPPSGLTLDDMHASVVGSL